MKLFEGKNQPTKKLTEANNQTRDKVIDGFWKLLNDSNIDSPKDFVSFKNGKLIIDLNDLNALNVNKKSIDILDFLNDLKNQL